MQLILSYILSSIYYIYFGIILLVFHVLQEVCRIFFGDKARKGAVDLMDVLLIKGLYILGSRIEFSGLEKVPEGRPVIIVSNHQSMLDIPAVAEAFRKQYTKFISKIELAKNIPSISINLKYGKSALIDRKNGSQSVKEILKLGKLIEENNYAACIFPEGTRSKTGKLGKFMSAGIGTLLRAAPSAVVVPFVIDGHSQLMRKGLFPLNAGQRITYTVLDPIDPKGRDVEEMVAGIREKIKQELL